MGTRRRVPLVRIEACTAQSAASNDLTGLSVEAPGRMAVSALS